MKEYGEIEWGGRRVSNKDRGAETERMREVWIASIAAKMKLTWRLV